MRIKQMHLGSRALNRRYSTRDVWVGMSTLIYWLSVGARCYLVAYVLAALAKAASRVSEEKTWKPRAMGTV